MTDLAFPYLDAQQRLHALVDSVDADVFNRKPSPKSWSAGECVVHLNKIAKGYLPLFENAVAVPQPMAPGPYHYGWVARRFIEAVRPGSRPIPTAGAMKPPANNGAQSDVDLERAVSRFDTDIDRYLTVIEAAQGMDLARIPIRSPFLPIMKLPMGAFLEALGLHSVRHIQQAERAGAQAA